MRPYSLDLRQRAVAAVQAGMPLQTAARTFRLGKSTLQRYLATVAAGRALMAKAPPGRRCRIGPDQELRLRQQVAEHPDATLDEHVAVWVAATGQRVSRSTLHDTFCRLGLSLKQRRSRQPNRARPSGRPLPPPSPASTRPTSSSSTRPERRSC